MLSRLVIQDVVLIDKLTLTLAAGLNVFTGETGAGKSILLDALGLALGERSDASLIRAGATQANVTAEFDGPLPPSLAALMEENGLTFDNPLILRRTIAKDGRSRAFINDQPVGIALMRQVGEGLLEIHGQFETHGLLNPATHRHLLDAFAGLAPLKQKVAEFYDTWQKARVDFETASKALERARN
ncbi:MAG: AAA family ATPase, partial [Alphaproteobacteria bacterium]|nr:AAA family ATPase [Alphaproteobacteria bacterium]